MYRKLPDKKNAPTSAIRSIKNVKRIFYLTRHDSVINKYHAVRAFKKMAIFGDRNNMEEAAEIAAYLRVDALTGNSPRIIKFTEYFKNVYDLNRIKCVLWYGRKATALQYKWLSGVYKNARIIYQYHMTEAGAVGKACLELNKKGVEAYHAANPELFYELMLFQKNKPYVGELAITSLTKNFPTPLIRYRTGDLIEILKIGKHECGQRGFLFRVLGRVKHDTAQLTHDLMLCAEDVEGAMNKLKINALNFRMHIYEKKYHGRIIPYMKLELISAKIRKINNISERISKKLILRFRRKDSAEETEPTVYDLVKNKEIISFEAVVSSTDANPNEKRYIMDHRNRI